jgi:hypothetical protein
MKVIFSTLIRYLGLSGDFFFFSVINFLSSTSFFLFSFLFLKKKSFYSNLFTSSGKPIAYAVSYYTSLIKMSRVFVNEINEHDHTIGSHNDKNQEASPYHSPAESIVTQGKSLIHNVVLLGTHLCIVTIDEDDMKIAQIESGSLPKVEEEKDGGYGWLVVLGAFCVQVTTFGMCNSWGKLKRCLLLWIY